MTLGAGVAVGATGAGCSSSSSPPPPASDDTNMDAGSSSGGGDGAAASCHVDASFTMFAESDAAAAGCAACVQTMCTDGIAACSSSCLCINLFSCLADAGVSLAGLSSGDTTALSACSGGISKAGALANDPGIQGVYTCFTMTCMSECAAVLPALDAGTTVDAGGPTATDAATTTDAADGG